MAIAERISFTANGDTYEIWLGASDAVKLIDEVLAVKSAEPVAWWTGPEPTKTGEIESIHDHETGSHSIPLYAHSMQPAPVVPEEKPMPNPLKMYAVDAAAAIAEVRGWNACRAAMLQAGNSPVTPDGWVMVPVEPTQEMIDAHVEGVQSGGMQKGYRAMLAAAPDFREISNSSTRYFREKAETSTNEPVCETHKLNGVIDENLIEALRLIQCMLDDYRDNNYGHAQSWVSHIDKRMGDYSDVHGDDAYSLLRDLLPAAPQQEVHRG